MRSIKRAFCISIILFLSISTSIFGAQTGKIVGRVVDSKTGEALPGALIVVDSTKSGAVTDLDGKFTIQLPEGKHKLSCHYVSYNTKVLSELHVAAGNTLEVTFTMDNVENTLKTVEVVANINKESTVGLLLMQKNSVTVSDGISSESIKKTPDKSTSDVLKRVSGASIQDNKFAIIRGLNDRYNAAYINGAPLPSSEPDRKAFAFDIFPANMLENLVIVKTATPDLPGEFAGGIIQINTKNIPEKNFQSISIGTGYNTITTGKQQISSNGGKLDWLGIDDGTRALPKSIPPRELFPLNMDQQANLAKESSIDWSTKTGVFAPNLNLQYSIGRTIQIKQKPLGILAAITYSKNNVYTETIRRSYSANGGTDVNLPSQIDYDYLDKTYSQQILSGGLANFSYKLSNNSNISFKNLYSINSDDKIIARSGLTNPLEANPAMLRASANWFTSNKVYTGQLIGEHYIPSSKIRINWMGSMSSIEREIPNLRRSIYTRLSKINDPSNPNPYDTTYTANISYNNVGSDYGGGMFFSKNNESVYSAKTDVSYSLPIDSKSKHDIKGGVFIQARDRNFTARQLGYTNNGKMGGNVSFKDSLLYLGENEIFNPENMGLIDPEKDGVSGIGGFKLTDGTKYSDSYTASGNLQAGYFLMDNKFDKIRIVWGARGENFTQKLNALKSDNTPLNLKVTKFDVLPSANVIGSISENQNLRFSVSQTVNRPEFRELAPFAFYDFNTQYVVSGNDQLKRAKITNYDLRYESFPVRGQLISASVFYKSFENPIEQVSRPDVDKEISFRNLSKAKNYGLELEFRVIPATLFKADSSKVLNNITVYSNLALIRSVVDMKGTLGALNATRPLQGQSPYVWNAGVQYTNTGKTFSASANLNNVGQRIAIVGNINEPDIWEKSRTMIDLQVTRSFLKNKLDIKLNAQNILAQNQVFYQNRFVGDYSKSNGFDNGNDDVVWSTKFGRVISLGAAYKF